MQSAHQLTADLLAKKPGNALLRSNQDIFESRLRREVAYPQLEMRLRAELDKLREQPDATEAMTTARRALLWILTQWETEEPGKGHGEQAAVVRKDLGLEPR